MVLELKPLPELSAANADALDCSGGGAINSTLFSIGALRKALHSFNNGLNKVCSSCKPILIKPWLCLVRFFAETDSTRVQLEWLEACTSPRI